MGLTSEIIFYLDKKTLSAANFYNLLEEDKNHPVSSQPSPSTIDTMYEMMSSNYKSTFALHLSKELSGFYASAEIIAKKYANIDIINSKHLSGSQGLLVLRLAEEIEKGTTESDLRVMIPQWIAKTKILTDIDTLKYFVRGGRISTLKGLAAQLLNLKPIISVDKNGKGIALGKSYSRKQNMKQIIKMITDFAGNKPVWNYAIVHAKADERANQYADKLKQVFEKEPAFIVNISPVIGVHNGIGSVAVCLMLK
ncbi:DegV family protein [Maridesulfovibrio ferrireducens]|uniref:DegV family protein n=1 Tax=Maridesulfovibrio ferrireducens TaxID=246191 RepID=UPI001A2AB7E1|nr:DegV family protein [Maridesulfovibrio ferrireducens]MBI9113203.1 DegV family protein [Maridesulfovibrio ferrireducens]